MTKYFILPLFFALCSIYQAQNLNWVRKVVANSINDVCTDDNNRQYSISYGNYLSNFSFNGNQISAPSNYTCGAIIKSLPSGNHEWVKFFSPVSANGS